MNLTAVNLSSTKEVCFHTANDLASYKVAHYDYISLLVVNTILAILIAYSDYFNNLINAPITIEIENKEFTIIKDVRLFLSGIVFYINIATVITNKILIKCI